MAGYDLKLGETAVMEVRKVYTPRERGNVLEYAVGAEPEEVVGERDGELLRWPD